MFETFLIMFAIWGWVWALRLHFDIGNRKKYVPSNEVARFKAAFIERTKKLKTYTGTTQSWTSWSLDRHYHDKDLDGLRSEALQAYDLSLHWLYKTDPEPKLHRTAVIDYWYSTQFSDSTAPIDVDRRKEEQRIQDALKRLGLLERGVRDLREWLECTDSETEWRREFNDYVRTKESLQDILRSG